METATTNQVGNTVITKEIVTANMSIALTKAQLTIQQLADEEKSLVYNEDNIPVIASHTERLRKAKAIIEAERKAMKEPYLRIGQTIDEGAKSLTKLIDEMMETPQSKLTSICQDVERRKREAEHDAMRKQNILSSIDSNMVSFSGKIAACQTDTELLAIERLINLEKGNRKKYQEFFDIAVEKYNSLTALLTAQKQSIREANELAAQRLEAEKKGDDAAVLELNEKQVALEAKIDENKIIVQETAISQSTATVIEVKAVIPDVKVRRQTWDFELVDISKTMKSMPSWTRVELVEEKIKEFLKASKDSWTEEGKEEVVVNGIRFFIRRTY